MKTDACQNQVAILTSYPYFTLILLNIDIIIHSETFFNWYHTTGKSCGLILPHAKSDGMEIFLEELSLSIVGGRHIALIVDNAGWHVSKELKVPDGITLIPLPSYSPELNAIEQIWEWLRNHHLSNQCFENYEHIVDKACEAWNAISSDSELIKSIIHRDWINS